MKDMKNKSLIGAAILLTLAAVVWLVNQYSPGAVSPGLVFILRWAGIAALCVYGIAKRSVTVWIFISMVVGACMGHDWPSVGPGCRTVSLIFLRLVKTLIAPLMFAMVVQGLAQHSDLKKTGRMGLKAIIYFEIITTIAIVIGLVAIQITKPGVGIHLPPEASSVQVAKLTASTAILNIFPENIGKAVAEGQTLQILVFSLLFGIGLAMAPEEKRGLILKFCDGLAATMFKVTNIVMMFAPFGVGAAIANSVSHTGLGVLLNMAKMVLTFYAALLVLILGVMLPIALALRIPVRRFIKAAAEPWTIAFATTSSEPALPRAMENLEAMGVSRRAIGVVLPTGYTLNLDGACVYIAMGMIFIAQVAGIHLTLRHQIGAVLVLMLASKGVANIPRGSWVVLAATVTSVGLPIEPVFLLLAIDEINDMARTSTNLLGNMLATVVVAKWEGEFELTPEKAEAVPAIAASA
jgi:proton glutamate symport protein